jgi:regulation of enolase protein 1 (concanavalin A-like superfamily)
MHHTVVHVRRRPLVTALTTIAMAIAVLAGTLVRPTYSADAAATAVTTSMTSAASGAAVSDDFSRATLDPRWSVVDPVGDGSVSLTGQGTPDAHVVLAVPAGTDHDVWGSNRGLLMLQPTADVDFAVEAKFDSVPALKYQMQGVLVRASASDWVRFGVFSDGSRLTAFAASTTNGASTPRLSTVVRITSSVRVRVTRSGPTWRFDIAPDGGAFTTVGSFTQAMAVVDLGVYSGNHATSGSPPEYHAVVDYFFNTATPIDPEDGAVSTPTSTTTTTPSTTSTTTTTPTTTTTTTTTAGGSGFTSDDFSEPQLASRWSVLDPVGGAQVALVGGGTQDARLSIELPGGANRDAWGQNGSTRVLAPVQNADLTLEARFDSTPTRKYQDQGLQLQQDAGRWLRFSTYSDGTSTYAFAASTVAGTSTARLKKSISSSARTWLRVTRSGSTWTMRVSPDGTSFTTIGSFTEAISLTSAGPYAGVSGSSGSAPAFTALVDYVFDLAAPISPEDGGAPADVTPPVVTGLTAAPGSQQAVVSWSTDEPSTGVVQLATGTNAYVDAARTSTLSTSQSVTVTGLTPSTDYAVRVIARDTAGNAVTTPGYPFRTRTSSGPQITVWLGDDQVFGARGTTQPWANILGNVSDPDGVSSLSYTLNGGSPRQLSLGPDSRRLQYPGDFNADIAMADLVVGANQVVLTAVDSGGSRTTRAITVRRVAAGPPSMPFSQSWTSTVSLDEQATVVDGRWIVGPDGVRVAPGATGYDRILALGDRSWRDFELTVPVTVHSFGPAAGSYLSGAPLVGLAMRWQGHQKVKTAQPAWGYKSVGAYAWFRWYDTPKLEMVGDGGTPKVNTVGTMSLGTPYLLKARAVTGAAGTTYSFKMWRSSSAEPSGWSLSFTQSGPAQGSVALIAHQLDATFGTVSVKPL